MCCRLILVSMVILTTITFLNASYVYTFAGNRRAHSLGDGGPATSAQLRNPADVTLSSTGEVYIADTWADRIRMVFTNGTITTFAGNGVPTYSGDGGPATSASIAHPLSIAISPTNEIYIADSNNDRIRVVFVNGTITTFAGNGMEGYSGDGGPALLAKLNHPAGVVLSATGEVYISDTDNHRVRVVLTNGTITTFAGNGTQSYSGDGGMAIDAGLNAPRGIAVSSTGELYIADSGNNCIRVVFSDGTIHTFAGNGELGYSGDGGPATSARLNYPSGVAVSPAGEVYISDSWNRRIRMVFTNGTIITFAGGNPSDYSGRDDMSNNSEFTRPRGIIISSTGELYIADEGSSVVRIAVDSPSIECSLHGVFQSQKYCICDNDYTGYFCQLNMCYGVNETSNNVCQSHGACVSPNNCSCFNGYTGYTCQISMCYGVNGSSNDVCSGNGRCLLPNYCECNLGKTGYNCQLDLVICYGKNGSTPRACSGHGLCKRTDFCECYFGYGGNQCHVNRKPLFALLMVPFFAAVVAIPLCFAKRIRDKEEYALLDE
jgi:hypothetical protein